MWLPKGPRKGLWEGGEAERRGNLEERDVKEDRRKGGKEASSQGARKV